MADVEKVFSHIDSLEKEMVDTLGKLISIPAISPDSGGRGELRKVKLLEKLLREMGFKEFQRIDAPDERAEGGVRPNLIVRVPGEDSSKRLWIVTHTDVVPEGERSLWETDPFTPVVRGEKLYGRGVEDNGQEMVASIYGMKALLDLGLKPKMDVYLCFVADEETGSKYGIQYLLQQELFRKDDLIIVPDGGNAEGTLLEVAEKSIVWVRVETKGKQCHASMPERGKNAHRAALEYGHLIDKKLHEKYSARNDLFDPPISTFEPTKKEANVPNVNTVPGEDVFYFDCRILPEYDVEDVLGYMQQVADEVAARHGVAITISTVQKETATEPTPPDAPVVQMLARAVDMVYHNDPKPGGIGGGTCAAIFRRAGYPAVVWAKLDDTCHAPNEYIWIKNLVNDAKVYAALALMG